MKKVTLIALFISIFITGCSNTGAFMSENQTIVNLNEGNYSISATNVIGQSEAGYIFGVSFSGGFMVNSFSIARVEGSGMLYADAFENLWENYAAEYGEVAEGALALANIQYDTDILNLFFYSKVELTIRADIIEFD
ncbi:MAG: DUF6567 family protein [Balneolales bacterium]